MGKVKHLTHQQVKQAIKRDELREFLEDASHWTRSHLESVIIGAVLLAVLSFGLYYYLNSRGDAALKASLQLSSAENQFQHSLSGNFEAQPYASAAAAYQGLKAEFDGRPEAAVAELSLANVDFQSGKFEEARQGYVRFLAAHPSSPLAPVALASESASLEALNKSAEAAELYLSIPQRYPLASNAAQSLVDAARIFGTLQSKARLKEVVAALEKLLSEDRVPEGLKSRLGLLKAKAS